MYVLRKLISRRSIQTCLVGLILLTSSANPKALADFKTVTTKSGKTQFVALPDLAGDPKIQCIPENTEWQLLKSFDGTPTLVFSFDEDHTFVVASNKENKTILNVIQITVEDGKKPKPRPTPTPTPDVSALQDSFNLDSGNKESAQALATALNNTKSLTTLSAVTASLKESGKTINLPHTKAVIAEGFKVKFPQDGPVTDEYKALVDYYVNEIAKIRLPAKETQQQPLQRFMQQNCPNGQCRPGGR